MGESPGNFRWNVRFKYPLSTVWQRSGSGQGVGENDSPPILLSILQINKVMGTYACGEGFKYFQKQMHQIIIVYKQALF